MKSECFNMENSQYFHHSANVEFLDVFGQTVPLRLLNPFLVCYSIGRTAGVFRCLMARKIRLGDQQLLSSSVMSKIFRAGLGRGARGCPKIILPMVFCIITPLKWDALETFGGCGRHFSCNRGLLRGWLQNHVGFMLCFFSGFLVAPRSKWGRSPVQVDSDFT